VPTHSRSRAPVLDISAGNRHAFECLMHGAMSLFAIAPALRRDYVGMRARDVTSPAFVLGITFAFPTARVFAQSTAVPVAYSAPGDCPKGAEFTASVLARGRNVTTPIDDSGAAMRIAIAPESSGGYRGTLRMAPWDRAVREVRGTTCREVVDALAVVTVSSLGPPQESASAAAPVDTPVMPRPSGSTPAPPMTPAAPSAAPGGAPQTQRASRDLSAGNIGTAPKEVSVGAGTLEFDRDITMTLYGGVATGIVPGVVLPRFDFEAARTNLITVPDGHSYRVVPTARLHFTLFPDSPDAYRSRYGTTTAGGFGIGADLCSPLYYDRTGLSMLLCAEFMGGFFGVQTTSPSGVKGASVLKGFSTGGLGLDFAYNLGRHFHIALKTGAALAIGNLTAEAPDGSQIFKSNVLGLHGSIGAGGHF
jgi:hypothetical protein